MGRVLAVARGSIWAVLVGASFTGCVDQGPAPRGKKIDASYVAQHILTQPPAGAMSRLDVTLGGKVVYLGNTIDKPTLAPGQTLRVTHYWRVVQPIGPGWSVFSLVRGAPNTADFMNLPPTDMQIAHGPAMWKAGEVIEDSQELTLRPDWKSPTATIHVGLIALGAHGVGDRMAATGPHTQDRAVLARVIDVDLSKAPPPAGTAYIPRASVPITVDGLAGEAAWATAAASPELSASEGSGEPVGKATAKLTWDDEFLYAFISVTDSDVVSAYNQHDDPLWKADCVELFLDADSNRRGYVELQVNPRNATFDSWFQTTRAQPGDPSWDSAMQTAVKLRGTAEPGDTDQGWDAELAIPWQAVRGRDEAMSVRLPPQVGDRWRMNVVRVDVKTGDKGQSSAAWNRITSADYHALDRMLTVVFADPNGSIQPVPPAAVPADPGAGSGASGGSAGGVSGGSAAGGGSGGSAAGGGAAVRKGAASGGATGSAAERSDTQATQGAERNFVKKGSAATVPEPTPARNGATPGSTSGRSGATGGSATDR